ncbi:unnamed protein product [Effrenium voratum]|uniref:Secreted protein n=1 Tax=Effrenium voratum TaxID=2562239 RepID=A0AA36JSE5_9DINO|nr:unnamed protein product [Effrenium voratum]CAJ1439040.1 unnamed protein product [Effrenium voratum]
MCKKVLIVFCTCARMSYLAEVVREQNRCEAKCSVRFDGFHSLSILPLYNIARGRRIQSAGLHKGVGVQSARQTASLSQTANHGLDTQLIDMHHHACQRRDSIPACHVEHVQWVRL